MRFPRLRRMPWEAQSGSRSQPSPDQERLLPGAHERDRSLVPGLPARARVRSPGTEACGGHRRRRASPWPPAASGDPPPSPRERQLPGRSRLTPLPVQHVPDSGVCPRRCPNTHQQRFREPKPRKNGPAMCAIKVIARRRWPCPPAAPSHPERQLKMSAGNGSTYTGGG